MIGRECDARVLLVQRVSGEPIKIQNSKLKANRRAVFYFRQSDQSEGARRARGRVRPGDGCTVDFNVNRNARGHALTRDSIWLCQLKVCHLRSQIIG